jgi:glucoamylase
MGRSSLSLLRPRPTLVGLAAATLVAGLHAAAPPASAATGPAPGAPGQAATWSPGDKDGFGTAISAPRSKV